MAKVNKKYQLVVFDWDGTLMDSTHHIIHCMKMAISSLQLSPLEDREISHIIGLGLPEAVKTLYPNATPATLKALADEYRHAWLTQPEQTELFEHAKQLIENLTAQEYFLAVATGKSRRGLDRAFNQTKLGEYFHYSRCADESQSKPNPQMLIEIMDYLGVEAEQTIMIGDTAFDLLMASNARADAIAITHGAHDIKKLSECRPKAILHSLKEVDVWFDSVNSQI